MSAPGGDGKDEGLLPAGDPDDPAEVEGGAAPGAGPTGLEAVPAEREQLEALRRERDEIKDDLLRRRAEFENFKRRVAREQEAAASDAAMSVLKRFVDTADNLERALAATGDEGALRRGVELTLHELLSGFEALGLTVVDPQGQRFDPRYHQALLHERVPGLAEGTVAEVFRKGYVYGDRLLRPALVKVAGADREDDGSVDGGGAGEVQ